MSHERKYKENRELVREKKREKEKEEEQENEKREKERDNKKREKRVSLYVRKRDVRCALKVDKLMILLLYKEAYLHKTNHNPSLPSVVVFLLQEFHDILPKEMPPGLPPIHGIRLILCLEL